MLFLEEFFFSFFLNDRNLYAACFYCQYETSKTHTVSFILMIIMQSVEALRRIRNEKRLNIINNNMTEFIYNIHIITIKNQLRE